MVMLPRPIIFTEQGVILQPEDTNLTFSVANLTDTISPDTSGFNQLTEGDALTVVTCDPVNGVFKIYRNKSLMLEVPLPAYPTNTADAGGIFRIFEGIASGSTIQSFSFFNDVLTEEDVNELNTIYRTSRSQGVNLSNAAIMAATAQQTSEVFVVLLTIDHPNFTQPIRCSSDNAVLLPNAGVRGTISRGEEYPFIPFSVSLPNQDDSGIAKARVSVDNIDRRMVQAVRTADSAISITIEIVLASSPDKVEVSEPDFKMESITYDTYTISGDLSLQYYDLEPYSKLKFTPSNFPGMF